MRFPERFFGSQFVRIGMFTLLFLIVLGGTFIAGMKAGEYRSALRATRHFRDAGFPPDVIRDMHPGEAPFNRPHGRGGEIISMQSGSLTLEGHDGITIQVLAPSDVIVQTPDGAASLDALSLGMHVIAVGKPDEDGAVHATMLLLPPWQQ